MTMTQKPKPLSDRQLRRLAAAKREADAAAETALRDAVMRDEHGKPSGVRPQALGHIEVMARNGASQNLVAAKLRVSAKQFKVLLGTGDVPTEVRLAFEHGRADFEQEIQARLLEHGKRWAPSLMFVAKARLGWREQESVVDLRAEDNRRIQIVLPAPMKFGEMLKGLGQREVADFRKDRSQPLALPEWAKQPALPAPDVIDGEFTEAPKEANTEGE